MESGMTSPSHTRSGRPPLPLDQVRSEVLRIRASKNEVDALYRAAARHEWSIARDNPPRAAHRRPDGTGPEGTLIVVPFCAPSGSPAWDRQLGESSRAFHAFCHYRDLGAGRSIDKAWRSHKTICDHVPIADRRRAPARWRTRAAHWGWTSRAEAWDAELDRQTREKLAKQQLEARERHQRLAQGTLTTLSAPVSALLQALQDPRVMQALTTRISSSPDSLLAMIGLIAQCAQAMPAIVSMERLALGLTTELLTIDENPVRDHAGMRIAEDPEATELAIALLDRIAGNGERLVH
jgi:hypothetical protein